MIRTALLLAAFALAGAPDSERIVLTITIGEHVTTAIVTPDGTMQVTEPEQHRIYQAGPVLYRRVAALVKPIRRWAGREVPCAGDSPPRPGYGNVAVVRIRWEPEDVAVEVPIFCQQGPARDEIELVRAALDETRSAAHDAPEAWDPAANSATVTVNEED